MDVLLVQWPEQEPERAAAAAAGLPRLLVVGEDEPPPLVADVLEDWVRASAPEADVEARMHTVTVRALDQSRLAPTLEDDVLHFGGRSVTLAPLDARLVRALIERFGAVVSRQTMFAAGWRGHAPHRNVLDVHLLRLRRRIGPLGLTVKTIRGRGYLLESEPGPVSFSPGSSVVDVTASASGVPAGGPVAAPGSSPDAACAATSAAPASAPSGSR